MLEIAGLDVWFGNRGHEQTHVVRDVSLRIAPGVCLGLVGESGCGKTTTALAALGLLPAGAVVRGEIRIAGRNILGIGERAMRAYRWTEIALIPQAAMSSLNPVRTVGRQMEEVMRIRRNLGAKSSRVRTLELLERVGLGPRTARLYPHELSGGMKQRAVIALALTCAPKVLVADEATTALDVVVQGQVLKLLRDIATHERTALMMISHDLAALSSVCDELAVMYHGRVVEQGGTLEVIRAPGHPHTQRLVSSAPTFGRPATEHRGPPPRSVSAQSPLPSAGTPNGCVQEAQAAEPLGHSTADSAQ